MTGYEELLDQGNNQPPRRREDLPLAADPEDAPDTGFRGPEEQQVGPQAPAPEAIRAQPREVPPQGRQQPLATPAGGYLYPEQKGQGYGETFNLGGQQQGGGQPSQGKASPQQALEQQKQELLSRLPPNLRQEFMLQDLKLSFGENKRLQQLQNASGQIDADPYLTEEDKAHAKVMLQTGINPLALRQAKAKVLEQEMKTQKEQAEIKRVAENTVLAKQTQLSEIDKQIGVTHDPNTGHTHAFFVDHKGDLVPIDKMNTQAAQLHQAKLEEAQVRNDDLRRNTELSFAAKDEKAFDEHRRDFAKMIEARVASHTGKDETSPQNAINAKYYEERGRDRRKELIDAEMKEHFGTASRDEYLKKQSSGRGYVERDRSKKEGVIGQVDPKAKPAALAPDEANQHADNLLQMAKTLKGKDEHILSRDATFISQQLKETGGDPGKLDEDTKRNFLLAYARLKEKGLVK